MGECDLHEELDKELQILLQWHRNGRTFALFAEDGLCFPSLLCAANVNWML
jgi:hypothetical protein